MKKNRLSLIENKTSQIQLVEFNFDTSELTEYGKDIIYNGSVSQILSYGGCVTKISYDIYAFYREWYILQRLNHPHINKPTKVQILNNKYGVLMYDSAMFPLNEIILYVGGIINQVPKHFRQLFNNKDIVANIKPAIIIKIMIAIFSAVDYLHTNGIMHADIKPANIIINVITFDVKIIDFNSSIIIGGGKYNAKIGTPGYRAPEISDIGSQKWAEYDSSIDIWGCGAVLYSLIFNKKYNNVIGIEQSDDFIRRNFLYSNLFKCMHDTLQMKPKNRIKASNALYLLGVNVRTSTNIRHKSTILDYKTTALDVIFQKFPEEFRAMNNGITYIVIVTLHGKYFEFVEDYELSIYSAAVLAFSILNHPSLPDLLEWLGEYKDFCTTIAKYMLFN